MYTAAGFIQSVNRFIRKETVGDVTGSEGHTSLDRFGSEVHIVVFFITLFNIVQNLERFINRSRLYKYALESTIKCTVFFDILTIFIKCSGTDTLDFTTSKSRFEHIWSVQRTGSTAGTDDGMNFVYEQDYIRRFFEFIHHSFHTFLELATIFCSGNERSQIKSHNSFIEKNPWHFTLYDTECKTFSDGRFTNSWFTNKDRIVLFTTWQDLRNSLNFLFTTNNRVEATFFCRFGKISSEVIQYRGFGFRIRRLLSAHTAATAAFIILRVRIILIRILRCFWFKIWFDNVQFFFHDIVVNTILIQNLSGNIVFVFQNR